MAKNILAKSGHHIYVSSMTKEEFDALNLHDGTPDNYKNFYKAQNWGPDGVVFFYMAKGYNNGYTERKHEKEVHVWYPKSKKMWFSFGKNFEDAINGAQADGWLYA